MNVLNSLGLDDKLRVQGAPCTHWEFANSHGEVLASMDLESRARYGNEGVACTRLALHQVLHQNMEDKGVHVEYSKRLAEIRETENDITAVFEDGSFATGDFLVGADGLHSAVRRILFPNAKEAEYIGLMGFGGGVPLKDLTETERALLPPPGHMRFVFGPLGFFGLSDFGSGRDGEQAIGWWSNTPEPKYHTKQEMQSMTQADVRDRLMKLHGTWASPIPTIITKSCSLHDGHPDAVTKINICDVQDLAEWTKGRAVLLGDAAHAMSPNSGQGASMALEDAQYLGVLFKQNPVSGKVQSPASLASVFSQFVRERKPRVDKINAAARRRGAQKLHPSGPWAEWFRDKFMIVMFWMQKKLGSRGTSDWEFGYKAPGWEVLQEQTGARSESSHSV